MNVMKRAREEDCIKLALIKIRPYCDVRVDPKPPRSGDRIAVRIDCDDGVSVPRQTGSQLARSTADLQNSATLDWREQFGDENFDAIFHLASTTDTTLHDQFVQVHDNVESFRRLLNFARPTKTRIIYASSAATYGPATEASVESNGAAPANVYAFSKVIMDNIAMRAAAESPEWIIVGLRYFN